MYYAIYLIYKILMLQVMMSHLNEAFYKLRIANLNNLIIILLLNTIIKII